MWCELERHMNCIYAYERYTPRNMLLNLSRMLSGHHRVEMLMYADVCADMGNFKNMIMEDPLDFQRALLAKLQHAMLAQLPG